VEWIHLDQDRRRYVPANTIVNLWVPQKARNLKLSIIHRISLIEPRVFYSWYKLTTGNLQMVQLFVKCLCMPEYRLSALSLHTFPVKCAEG
jgi:hypothetical protein